MAILIVTIASLLLFIWVVVYITQLYPYEDVYMGRGPRPENNNGENNYRHESKFDYVIGYGLIHFINVIFFAAMFLAIRHWVNV